jgi:P-type Mg2+ transporter
MPVERYAHASDGNCDDPFDLPNFCFMGANVVSGYGTGVILQTGPKTFFGQLAHQIAGRRVPTAFDQGINRFTLLMIRFILVMVPTVFLINGLTKHDWLEALARLAFRLAVVLVFALAWPGEAPARAAGLLCLALAAGCFGVAWT